MILSLRVCLLLTLCSATSLTAQSASPKTDLLRLGRERDSLKKVNDSLSMALRARGAASPTTIDSLKKVIDSLRATGKAAPSAVAAPTGPIVFKAGKWSVDRTIDKMTDAPTCTGIYDDAWKVQLGAEGMYISLKGRGGVKGVTLRYGDEPARALRLATDMEKSVSAVILKGDDFTALQHVLRLRVQVFTILESIVVEDIDLNGMQATREFVVSSPTCQNR